MSITIYHNQRCSKSREACQLLTSKNNEVQIIEYLKTPFTETSLKKLISQLAIKPSELVRKKEPIYLEKFAKKKVTDSEWIKIMVKHPILIERPIVVKGNKALICRPPELVKKFL